MKRIPRRTIAWWIRAYGFRIEYWRVFTSPKTTQTALMIICYGPDMSTHDFYF